MIVPMKQVTLLMSERHRDSALARLRKLGVVHVKDIQVPASDNISNIEAELENINRTLQLLADVEIPEGNVASENVADVMNEILDFGQQKEALNRELNEKNETHAWFEKWSAVSYDSLEKLKQAGVFVRFYITDKNGLKTVPAEKTIQVVSDEGGTIQLALFSESEEEKLDFKEDVFPQVEYSELVDRIEEIKNQIIDIGQEIHNRAKVHSALDEHKVALNKKLELANIKAGMGAEAAISFLQGYCPEEKIDDVKAAADEDGWAYIIEEPDDPSEVPTLTRNPKPIGIIKPLFDFMGTLPGYEEMDTSPVFLIFFSLFFAMIIGDAGYGLVFLAGTIFAFTKRNKNIPITPYILFFVLSGATICWGLLTGTWFGSQTIARLPFLSPFIIDQLNSFGEGSQDFMMFLSFVIGAIHLSIAHLLAGLRKIKSITCIAEFAWMGIIWSLYFVGQFLVLSKPLPGFMMPLFIASIVLVLFFANFQKNILKGIAITLGNLLLDVISGFSDVVSYLRLFAVGYATVVVASSFNGMAIGDGISSVVAGFGAAIILLLGHGLNIVLAMMSVLVHGVRLNMLEFSGHVGVNWSGKPYEPFKE
jgi:V/A-type H+/Na+-transporting ATPase subunit I